MTNTYPKDSSVERMEASSCPASVFRTSLMRMMSTPFMLKYPMRRSMASRASGRSSGESRSMARISMQPDISQSSSAPRTMLPLTSGYIHLSP